MNNVFNTRVSVFLMLTLALLFISCSDEGKELEPEPRIEFINFHAGGREYILQDIRTSHYLNSKNDTLGVIYVGFVDERRLITYNSVALYISKNLSLDHVDYVYSEEGTNWGTSYKHFDIENNSPTFSYDIEQNGKVIEGRFSGELYSGLPNDVIVVDSCSFRLHR